jgi:hypothetical protein
MPLLLSAFREGPFPGMTGGFGEPTCVACHLDNPVNDPGGSLRLTGLPRTYSPGQQYALRVVLTRAGLHRGGFEISARFAGGRAPGQQAGVWKPLDSRVQIVPSVNGKIQYAQHTAAGTLGTARDRLEWTIGWIAPANAGVVIFNVAGNASNDDASALGDFIYTTQGRSAPARAPSP